MTPVASSARPYRGPATARATEAAGLPANTRNALDAISKYVAKAHHSSACRSEPCFMRIASPSSKLR